MSLSFPAHGQNDYGPNEESARTPGTNLVTVGRPGGILSLPFRPSAAGLICFCWDDGYGAHKQIASHAAARGQQHTFFINSASLGNNGMLKPGDLIDMSLWGHEIGSHGVLHQDVVPLSAAARIVQWETDKAALEAILGVGTITSYAYPLGSRDATTDQQLYGRFDRIRGISHEASSSPTPPFITRREHTDTFLSGGLDLFPSSATTMAHVMTLIEYAAVNPVVVTFYGHNAQPGFEMDQVIAAMDLAEKLGVPCVTMRQAFPADRVIRDFSFEDPNLARWPTVTQNGGSVQGIAVTPMDGIPGTRSLRLSGSATNSTAYVSQRIPLRIPSVPIIVSGRVMGLKTGGAGNAYVRFRWQDASGVFGSSATNNFTLAETWARFSFEVTVSSVAHNALIDFVIDQFQGDVTIDHVHVGPKVLGSYG